MYERELYCFYVLLLSTCPCTMPLKILYKKKKKKQIEDEKRRRKWVCSFSVLLSLVKCCVVCVWCTVSLMHKHVYYWTMIAFYFLLLSLLLWKITVCYFWNNQMNIYAILRIRKSSSLKPNFTRNSLVFRWMFYELISMNCIIFAYVNSIAIYCDRMNDESHSIIVLWNGSVRENNK